MDLTVLTSYANLTIVGICLCVGFIVKYAIRTDKVDRFIPLIVGILGVVLVLWSNAWTITPELLLEGLFSGLASTGLYETFKNLINKKKEE